MNHIYLLRIQKIVLPSKYLKSHWSKKRIFIAVILISLDREHGLSSLDLAKYCSNDGKICEEIKTILGGKSI